MESIALVPDRTHQQLDLIDECRKGDRVAMRALYIEHQRRVYSIAFNFFGGDASKADDVTQQVFLKIFMKFSFRGEANFTTWLHRMTVNACIDETRKSRRWFGLADWFEGREPATEGFPDDAVYMREISDQVRTAMRSLKPIHRLPVILKYVEGLSYDEIADVLDCSVGTVSSRINRAHKLLAQKLGHLRGKIT